MNSRPIKIVGISSVKATAQLAVRKFSKQEDPADIDQWPNTIKLLEPIKKSFGGDNEKGVNMKAIFKYIDARIDQKIQPYMDKIEVLQD